MLKLAPEGYPFIAAFSALTIAAALLVPWLAVVSFMLTLFMGYFFRDPERIIPDGDRIFVSPADGKVILIDTVREDRFLKNDFIEVSIFMSPLNVHVNRSPCDGTVESVTHIPGKFISAFKHEASAQNEQIAMVLSSPYGKILVRQVAGFVARRAVCRVTQGYTLKKGERYGIIKFSSRLDVYLPKEAVIKVAVGDRVRAGETIIAERQLP